MGPPIENSRKEVAAVLHGQTADKGEAGPEPLVSDEFVEVNVVNDEQATLFEVREYESPAAAEIRDSAIEKGRLECVASPSGVNDRG